MNWELPTGVVGHMLSEHRPADGSAAVPTEFAAELFFANGVSASFYCSFSTEIQQWANLAGTRGSIHVPDFVLPRYGAELVFDVSNPDLQHHGLRLQHGRTRAPLSRSANIAIAPRTRKRRTWSAGSPNWCFPASGTTRGARCR